jgi:hypothetical protein
MPLGLLLLAAGAVGIGDPEIAVMAPHRPFRTPVLGNTELAIMRGGLRLPNGLDVSLGIDIQTRVNGLLALHTVYASEGPAAGVRVFVDGAKPVPLAPATQTISASAVPSMPVLVVDRSPAGTTLASTTATPAATVNLVNGDPSIWLSGEGQVQLPVVAEGPAVATEQGDVRLATDDRGAVVTLQAPSLFVQQLVGQATGVVLANSGSDRTIDTVSSVNVDLQGVSPALLSGLFAAQRAALDAVVGR